MSACSVFHPIFGGVDDSLPPEAPVLSLSLSGVVCLCLLCAGRGLEIVTWIHIFFHFLLLLLLHEKFLWEKHNQCHIRKLELSARLVSGRW
jgi:hypothetical protein